MGTERSPHRLNIVIFGDKGVGKSSLVNLILGSQMAKIASDESSSTLDAKPYDVTIQDKAFRIYDTVGLYESQVVEDTDRLIGAINKAYRLVQSVADTGGIDLLILCVQKDRFTDTLRYGYKVFYDFLCHGMVPVALVITHFDHNESAEDWWRQNEREFTTKDIHVIKHACITAKPEFNAAYEASRKNIHDLLLEHHNAQPAAMEKARRFVDVMNKTLEVVRVRSRFRSVKAKTRMLGECGLSDAEIEQVLRWIAYMDADIAAIRRHR
ncbi:P-loop containing nucleoside triphosphate hydrolase protein [Scleroderma yunnanense]